MALKRITSGGQRGVDRSGLDAGRLCSLETGGWISKGCKALDGDGARIAALYGLQENDSEHYRDRTRDNVQDSDATILLAVDLDSRGSKCARRAAEDFGKTLVELRLEFPPGAAMIVHEGREPTRIRPYSLAAFIYTMGWQTLNIAGNRDESLEAPVRDWLVEVFGEVLRLETRETLGEKHGATP